MVFTFGASGSLAQQIEHGAPYDVYLSANQLFVKQLADSGRLAKDTVAVYANGRVALWSRSGQIRALADLLKPEVKRIAIANPAHAPYGVAARESLRSQGVWGRVEAKVVYGESVADALQFAQSGNADAAIVAYSQVLGKGGIALPAVWHAPIAQSGGVVAASKHGDEARKFMRFLAGGEGKAVLRKFGFDTPD